MNGFREKQNEFLPGVLLVWLGEEVEELLYVPGLAVGRLNHLCQGQGLVAEDVVDVVVERVLLADRH